ncbi:MAG: LamG-like jellyroll fold domain-containing protein [Lacipirellulaceae bacterium]
MTRPRLLAASAALCLAASAQGVLVNRYTFNNGNANDSVGTGHGTVVDPTGLAIYVGGQLDLSAANNGQRSDGTGALGAGAHVNLPNGLATSALSGGVVGQASFEVWSTVSTNRQWARYFDFGRSNGGEDVSDSANGEDNLALSPTVNLGGQRLGFLSSALGTNTFVVSSPATAIPVAVQQHVVVTVDQNPESDPSAWIANVYLNGALNATGPLNSSLARGSLFDEVNNWLGRSQYGADSLFDGSFNEFSVYSHALAPSEVSANFTAGPLAPPGPTLVVDRATGGVTVRNNTGSAISLASYSITSATGGLSVSPAWDPIAPASGWSVSSQTVSALTESGGTAQSIGANGGQINLGTAWNSSPFEDLNFSFTLQGGQPTLGAIQYTGNGGVAYGRSDLDTDGDLDAADWSLFLTGNATNLAGQSQVQRYLKGDLNNDGANSHADFLVFRSDYITANGSSAFANLLAAVPEPSSATIVGLVVAGMAGLTRRARRGMAVAAVVAVAATAATDAEAALRNRYSFSGNLNDSVGGQTGVLVDTGTTANGAFVGGQLDFSSNPVETSNQLVEAAYVDLPNNLISSASSAGQSGAVSLAWWATVSEFRVWARLGDFGTSQSGEGVADGAFFPGGRNIFVTPNDGRGPNFGLSAYNSVDGEFNAAAGPNLGLPGGQVHVVASYDTADTNGGANPNGTVRLYLNGNPAATASMQPGLNLNAFVNNNNWLGRAQFDDAVFNGKFNEFRVYDTALTPAQVLFNEAVGPDAAPLNPGGDIFSLTVNNSTGAVTLVNNLAFPITLNYYKVSSASGALSTSGWNSLDDKESGDAPGLGWDESGGSDANELIEFVLPQAGATIAANAQITLGSAFNTSVFGSGNNGDLAFEFGTLGGAIVPGSVSYVTAPGVVGDYNSDGVVNAADYTVWRDRLGTVGPLPNRDPANTGNVSSADYASWVARYGQSASSSTAIPEPASALVTLLAIGAAGRRRAS